MSEVLQKAKALESDLVAFLQDMVACPSTSCNEKSVIERMKAEMEKIGYDEVKVDPLGNLLGRMGCGPKVVVIDGHCDVVDVGNPDLWEVEPFGRTIKDGKIYGRGSCDQKGGLACGIYAGRLLKEVGLPDSITLWVIASIQEEDLEGMSWKYIVDKDQLGAQAVLITEPTDLNIYRGHRGRVEIKVSTQGISCHGSAPERGENAVYKMAPLVQEIEELHNSLKDDPFLGKGSVTISEIRSTSPSLCAVADSCTLHLDRRLTAGETIETALEEIRALPSFAKMVAKVWVEEYKVPSYTGLSYPIQSYCPTWVLEEDHPLLKTAFQSYQNLFSKEPKVDKWTFSTNGVGSMGRAHIPTFGFGPGNEVMAHSPNEYIPIDDLHKALAFYTEFVRNFAEGNPE